VIKTWARMHACEMRLLSSCFEQSFENPAGSLIREFDFTCLYSAQEDHRHDEEQANALVTLILIMPQLCKISLRDWIVGYAELVSISRTCRDTLTHLSILISSDGHGVFAILNTLQKLQQLHLSVEGTSWKHSTCHPLTLTSATNLWWNAQDGKDHTQMIRYLAQCSFGPEASFRLDIPSLDPTAALLLRPLFARNQLRELRIDMPPSTMAVLSSEILQVPSLEFHNTMPHPDLLDTSHLPHTLVFRYPEAEDPPDSEDDEDVNNEDRFWDVLNQLAASHPTHGSQAFVRVWDDEPNEDFDWLEGSSTRHSTFVGRLLKVAVPLHKRGVIVVDRHGRDVKRFL
jgi:hypothetical protein